MDSSQASNENRFQVGARANSNIVARPSSFVEPREMTAFPAESRASVSGESDAAEADSEHNCSNSRKRKAAGLANEESSPVDFPTESSGNAKKSRSIGSPETAKSASAQHPGVTSLTSTAGRRMDSIPGEDLTMLAEQLLRLNPSKESHTQSSSDSLVATAHQLLQLDQPNVSTRDQVPVEASIKSKVKETPVPGRPPASQIPAQCLLADKTSSPKVQASPQEPHRMPRDPENIKNGIFDDAESDSEAAMGNAVGMQNADKTLSSTKGGIFDDADEDSFVAPVYEASTLPDAHLPPQIVKAPNSPLVFSTPDPSCEAVLKPASPALSESRRAEGKANTPVKNSTKTKGGEGKAKSPVKTHAKAKGTDDKSGKTTQTDAKKKKKPTKPVKRVLIGKKEKDLATTLLSDKDDLAGIISHKHCLFLGKELWIFTVQQLEYVLLSTDTVSGDNNDTGTGSVDSPLAGLSHRAVLADKVAKSELVRSPEGDETAEAVAEEILLSWLKKIELWKSKGESERNVSIEKKFELSGSVSCLFPPVSQNFFASVPMKSLYDFLCLKKTETGRLRICCAPSFLLNVLPILSNQMMIPLLSFFFQQRVYYCPKRCVEESMWHGRRLAFVPGEAFDWNRPASGNCLVFYPPP